MSLTLEEKRRLCELDVTLDGKPARIQGARLKCATVATHGGGYNYQTAQFSWEAVKRIVANGGRFKS